MRILQNPRPAAELYVIDFSIDDYDAQVAHGIRPFFEPNLPGGLAVPISQPFTTHTEVIYIVWMKNKYNTRNVRRSNFIGELVLGHGSTAILFCIQIPV